MTKNTLKHPTLPEFKAWAQQHHDLAMAVCEAMAYAQAKREQVDAYIKPVFDEFEFRVNPKFAKAKGERVTTPRDLYLCDDEEECKRFYEACDAEHRKHGFDGPKGHCPALVAEHLLIIAENALLDAGCELFGLDQHPYLEKRRKMLDLLIGACLKKAA